MPTSAEFGDKLNQIGVAAVGIVGDDDATILIYADITDEGEDIVFLAAGSGEDRLRTPDGDIWPVADALRAAWLHSRAQGPARRWTAIAFRVADRRMAVDLLDDGDAPADEGVFAKQDRLVDTYFPGMRAD